jgi:hypothetical protein
MILINYAAGANDEFCTVISNTMKQILILSGLLLAFLFACRNQAEQTSDHAQTPVTHEDHAAGVSLNNGEKWQANPETIEGIRNMISFVDAVPASPTMDDCQSLKSNLENEFKMIFEKCTMTGEAHDQLHNYLLPLKDRIANLNDKEGSSCTTAVESVKQHLGEFGNYFM